MSTILILALHRCGEKFADVELYAAGSDDEAERFCNLWNENELALVEIEGGYPGEAFTASLPIPTSRWVREHEADMAEAGS